MLETLTRVIAYLMVGYASRGLVPAAPLISDNRVLTAPIPERFRRLAGDRLAGVGAREHRDALTNSLESLPVK